MTSNRLTAMKQARAEQRNGRPRGEPVSETPPALPSWPPILPASALQATDDSAAWIAHGLLVRDGITLFSGLPKAGKSTLITWLLVALQSGARFCGRNVAKGSALIVTEESQSLWAKRRDTLGYGDDLAFLCQPFMTKPRRDDWQAFVAHVAGALEERPADLVVFDCLSALWPVRDENDAADVQAALMPLRLLARGRAVLLVHHLRKSDGQEGTAARGSGALAGFVDVLLELRRFDAQLRDDRRRVLTGLGRYDGIPSELVVELAADGGYVALGDRHEVTDHTLRDIIADVLPTEPPGMDSKEIGNELPDDAEVKRAKLHAVLAKGREAGWWKVTGKGVSRDPYRYYRGVSSTDSQPLGENPVDEIDTAILADLRATG